MYNRKNIILIFSLITLTVLSTFLLSFNRPQEKVLISKGAFKIEEIADRVVSASAQIINFETYSDTPTGTIHLLLSGTYGSILLTPQMTDAAPIFSIPPAFTKHAGTVAYYLMQNKQILQKGTFKLLPNTQNIGVIETYLGPRSIIANPRDYTMLVSIPTDTLDNTLPDGTPVNLNTQFKTKISTTTHKLSSGFTWKRISAPLQIGRISTGSTLQSHASKELVADIFPDVPQDFSISVDSNHNYADGNEIITLQTTQIKDEHGNIMTDGTMIIFFINDETEAFWQTTASTVNGYAFAKALHPQSPSTWKITAAITGIAQSKEISQTFTPIITKIPLTISQKRHIIVGPLTSYMGQLVQDGIGVSLLGNGMAYEALTENGKTRFHLKEEDYPKGDYTLTIKALGIEAIKKITID